MDSTTVTDPAVMEGFNMLWSLLASGLIVPLVQWIKKKLPADFPLGSQLISATLAFGVVYGLVQGMGLSMTIPEMLGYSAGVQVAAQAVHAAAKTPKKMKG